MYSYIASLSELSSFQKSLINRKDTVIGFDIETSGLDPYLNFIRLIQVEIDNKIFLFDAQLLGDKNIIYICSLLQESDSILVGFNLKFDLKFIKSKYNLLFTDLIDLQSAEVMVTNGLALSRYPSLDDICLKYLGIQLDKTVRKKFYEDPFGQITEDMLVYSTEDVMYLKRLKDILLAKLIEQKQLDVFNLENRLTPVTVMMELEGILLDKDKWENLAKLAEVERDLFHKKIKDYILNNIDTTKFNSSIELSETLGIKVKLVRDKKYLEQVDSTYALTSWIYERLNPGSHVHMKNALNLFNIPVEDTNEDTLVLFAGEPLIDLILEYRNRAKRVSTYGVSWFENIHPTTGRIHSKFNQLGATSGRYSSDSINLQNIPKLAEYRATFIARPGYKLLRADYNQEEYRLVGEITEDELIIKAYQEGKDMHTSTAALVNHCTLDEVIKEQRDDAKNINFASLFGSSAWGLSKKLHISQDVAEDVLIAINTGYPTMVAFRKSFGEAVLSKGHTKTLLGRKRYFDHRRIYKNMEEAEKENAASMREGYNMLIQGSAADIIKDAMCNLFYNNPFEYKDFHILMQVHDEVVIEVKDEIVNAAIKFVEETMLTAERIYLKVIPAAVEITVNDYWSK